MHALLPSAGLVAGEFPVYKRSRVDPNDPLNRLKTSSAQSLSKPRAVDEFTAVPSGRAPGSERTLGVVEPRFARRSRNEKGLTIWITRATSAL